MRSHLQVAGNRTPVYGFWGDTINPSHPSLLIQDFDMWKLGELVGFLLSQGSLQLMPVQDSLIVHQKITIDSVPWAVKAAFYEPTKVMPLNVKVLLNKDSWNLHTYVWWGQNIYRLSAREISLLFLGIISIHFVNTNYSDQKNFSLSPPTCTYLPKIYVYHLRKWIYYY